MAEAVGAWDWMVSQKDNITFALALLAFLRPWSWIPYLLSRPPKAARLDFGLERGEVDNELVLRVVNVGGSPASEIHLRWVPQSSLSMEPVPQPAILLPGEHLPIRFSTEPLDVLLHGRRAGRGGLLGWLEITYSGRGWRRSRTGTSFVPPAGNGAGEAVKISLSSLPRRTPKEALPWLAVLEVTLGFEQRRQRKEAKRQEQEYSERLAAAHKVLANNGIDLGGFDEEAELPTRRLFGELGRRGWRWDYGPGGLGYETVADKRWPPSSSMTIRLSGKTPQDSAVLVLASAIQEDKDRGTHVAPFRPQSSEDDRLNLPAWDHHRD